MSSLPPPQHAPATDDEGTAPLSPANISKRLKSTPRIQEDDGFPLDDEALLLVLASSLAIADLLSCSATCRRWRRLVTSEAEFICRRRPPNRRLVRSLTIGFFHQRHDDGSGAPPRFLPLLPSFSRRRASLDAIFDGHMFKNSRLVASRKGRVVLELGRASRAGAPSLAVCDPFAGDVSILPTLFGMDVPGNYACAFLTADDDLDAAAAGDPLPSPAAFRVVVVYNKRHNSDTVCRCYSSEAQAWGPDGNVMDPKATEGSSTKAQARPKGDRLRRPNHKYHGPSWVV